MTGKKIISLIAILPFLFADTIACALSKRIITETMIGIVVAHDDGLELAIGSCRQSAIVRIKKRVKRKPINEYILVRYQYSCATRLPNEMLSGKQQWRFSVTRDVNCDAKLEDLLYIGGMNEDGTVYRIPLLKRVSGAEAEKIPADVKLPCYILLPNDFKIDKH